MECKRIVKDCPQCGNEYWHWRSRPLKFCSARCYGLHKRSTGNPRRYVLLIRNGKCITEHRWFMQEHLGRKLTRSEHVHHLNGNPRDNRIENLTIISASQHAKLHGNWNTRRLGKEIQCQRCGKWVYTKMSRLKLRKFCSRKCQFG
jgi:endogenous inhibitor of DNA gyrase (YacG/DUF329 family)